MNGRYLNRLTMFRTALATLDGEEHRGVWQGQAPVVFTRLVVEAKRLVDDLAAFGELQERSSKAATEHKQVESAELKQLAHLVSGLLAAGLRRRGDADAREYRVSLSKLRVLRDPQLLARARAIHERGVGFLATDAELAAEWGITRERLDELDRKVRDSEEFMTAPETAITQRRARTLSLRDRFREVTEHFLDLDHLIRAFGHTESGSDLVAAWSAARSIRKRGRRPASQPSESTPASEPLEGAA